MLLQKRMRLFCVIIVCLVNLPRCYEKDLVQGNIQPNEGRLVVRDVTSSFAYFEVLDIEKFIYYQWRVRDCTRVVKQGTSERRDNFVNITGLQAGFVYHVDFEIFSDGRIIRKEVTFKTLNKELEITNLHASIVSTNQITVSWNALKKSVWYRVHILKEGIQLFTEEGTGTKVTFHYLNPGTHYKVFVRGYVPGIPSVKSDEISITTLYRDGDVRNLVVVNAYDDGFDLRWDSFNGFVYTITGKDLEKEYSTKNNHVTIVTKNAHRPFTIVNIGTRNFRLFFRGNKKRQKITNVHATQASNDTLVMTWNKISDSAFYTITLQKLNDRTSHFKYRNIKENKLTVSYLQADCTYHLSVETQIAYSTITSDPVYLNTQRQDGGQIVNIEVISMQENTVTLRWSDVISPVDFPTYEVTVSSNEKLALTINKNQATISNLVGRDHIFTVTLKAVNGKSLVKTIAGKINVTLPSRKGQRKPYVKGFVLTETAHTWLHVRWNPYIGASKYILKYSGDKKQFGYIIQAEPFIKIFEQNVTSLISREKFELSVQAYVEQDILSSRIITAFTGDPSNTTNIQAVDVFADSVDFYWSRVKKDDVIYKLHVDDGTRIETFNCENKNKFTLWQVQGKVLNVTLHVIWMHNLVTTSAIQVILPEEEKPKIGNFQILEKSSRGFTAKWSHLKGYKNYRVFYTKEGSSVINVRNVSENQVKLLNLDKGKKYQVWIQSSEDELVQYRSRILTVETLQQDLDSINSISAVNVYSDSFDLEWSHFPHATYMIKTVPDITSDKEYKHNATTLFTSLDDRVYRVFVQVKKLRGIVWLNETITSEVIKIKLPKKGSLPRPEINLWIVKQDLSGILLSWDAIDRQSTFSIDHQCCGRNKSSTARYFIGGLNEYETNSMSPDYYHPLNKGVTCSFRVFVHTIERRAYYFDWRSNEVHVDFLEAISVNKTKVYDNKAAKNVEMTSSFLVVTAMCIAAMVS